MNSTLGTINAVASWIPSKIRGVIYALIGVFWLLDEIWHILPDTDRGDQIALTIKLLAVIMAVVNTDLVPDPRPPVVTDDELEAAKADGAPLPPPLRDAGESVVVTILAVLAIVVLVGILLGWIRL